jgi:hypothetical protein
LPDAFCPEVSVSLPDASMYFIVGNPVTPESSGVADASISTTFTPPETFFFASCHAGLFASQWGHPIM